MAITQDYVAFATGNDYKGASFTDGAYTSATKTLTKAGAFTATKVNHYLYLESNDGGSIVAGYYKVADVTGAPNAVVLASDAGAGVDDDAAKCTQAAGTALLPWRSLQGAFDLCTRNATDGNQVNLKAGTAHVNPAALSLTTFVVGAALSDAAPLIVRGYTAAANDGGIGEIDCGGATMWAVTTYDYVCIADLKIHNGGDNDMARLRNRCLIYNCEATKGASSPATDKTMLYVGSYARIIGCYAHDGPIGITVGGSSLAYGNYIADCLGTSAMQLGANGCVGIGNIIKLSSAGVKGINMSDWLSGVAAIGNIVYNTAAGTSSGIDASGASDAGAKMVMNNILVGFSGAGGEGVNANNLQLVGFNAFYNNTATYTMADQKQVDLTANDVALAADPFTDAANGDFSLTAAAKTALAAKGLPLLYLGAHANTVPNLNIGPIQMAAGGAGGGGFPILGGSIVR